MEAMKRDIDFYAGKDTTLGLNANVRVLARAFSIFVLFAITHNASAAVDVVCDKRFTVDEADSSLVIPYCSNVDLDLGASDIERVIIVIHGNNRNADDYYSYVENAGITAENAYINTAIIAPQFLTESDIDTHNLYDDHLFWSSSGWKKGNTSNSASAKPRPFNVSSFEVVDQIIIGFSDDQRWPRVTEVVIAGHSAGGQFVNRYAAGGWAETELLAGRPDVGARYIVANPSSQLYYNATRAVAGSLDIFETPDARDCPEYDDYKYGLKDKNNYMTARGNTTLGQNYQGRTMIMLLGEFDDNPKSSSMDKSCEAMLQGAHRLERGQIYFNHIQDYFGSQVLERHRLDIIAGVGHTGAGMFQSPCGLKHLYDYDPDMTACSGVSDTGGSDSGGSDEGSTGGGKGKGGGIGGGQGGGKGKDKKK